MEYNELFEKYRKLLEENQKLLAENEYLTKRLGLPLTSPCTKNDVQASIEENNIRPVEATKPGHVTNSSSQEDKINLFISLFRGRDDVYAKRWQNKEGKSGYSPVCLNEWARGICNKPKIKCSECDNKNYAALDFAAIDKHLRGKDVFGIYPMLPDETCYLLAIDFDDEGWEDGNSIFACSLLVPDSRISYCNHRKTKSTAVWNDFYTRNKGEKEIDDFEKWFDREFEAPVKMVFDNLLKGHSLDEAE